MTSGLRVECTKDEQEFAKRQGGEPDPELSRAGHSRGTARRPIQVEERGPKGEEPKTEIICR